MKYSIVFSSQTGNTKLLAETLRDMLPPEDSVYFGVPCDAAEEAERVYVGFWTNKGTCDAAIGNFLNTLHHKEVFLFGTAGFGGDTAYFEKILQKTKNNLHGDNTVVGAYMCQGRMPMSVRQRYEKLMLSSSPLPNLKAMIENFDAALSHPDEDDLRRLSETAQAL